MYIKETLIYIFYNIKLMKVRFIRKIYYLFNKN